MGSLIDLTGMKFERMTVIRRNGIRRDGLAAWLCRCDCGNEKIVVGVDLRKGKVKSCRCYHRDIVSLPEGVAASNELFLMYKQSAKKMKREFNIPRELFDKLITSDCYYCGKPPYQVFRKPNERVYRRDSIVHCGLDRFDNNRGYDVDNVVSCCWICNRAKNNLSGEEFIKASINIANKWKDDERFVHIGEVKSY